MLALFGLLFPNKDDAMKLRFFCCLLASLLTLGLSACSSNDDDDAAGTSTLNPDLNNGPTPGAPGGDTTAIAGLWDQSRGESDSRDIFYWSIAENGVLTFYDYQQDQGPNATGENCYIAGDPITVTPGTGNSYAIAGTETAITVTDNTITIVFQEADAGDLDEDGDTTETPTYNLPAVSGLTATDLTACSDG